MSEETTSPVTSCLNILRRVLHTEENLSGLFHILSTKNEEAAEELLQRVDVPLKVATDSAADGRPYLICDHNRDGDSYRSPWSNQYFPPLEDGLKPSQALRDMEIQANEIFHAYRELYYGKNAISSVYLWDMEEEEHDGSTTSSSFAGTFLIRKSVVEDGGDAYVKEGYWNSIHVVEVGAVTKGKALYKLTTTILISMQPTTKGDVKGKKEKTFISGSLSRQTEKLCPVQSNKDIASTHIENIGKMIENMEIDMRSNMDSLYIQKTKEVVESIRREGGVKDEKRLPFPVQQQFTNHAMMLNQAVLSRGKNR